MKTTLVISITCLALWCGTSSGATEVLGSAEVDGRKVDILSDGTWRFFEPLPETCQPVTADLMLCAEDGKWTKVRENTSRKRAVFQFNDFAYGLVIVDGFGSSRGISKKKLRDNVIEIAARHSGNAISVIGVEGTVFLGLEAETISYSTEVDDVPVVYRNTVAIHDEGSIQAATYEIAKELTEFHTTLHAEFVSEIRTRD